MKRVALGLIALMASSVAWAQLDATAIALQWLEATEPAVWQTDRQTGQITLLRWEPALPLPQGSIQQKAQYIIEQLTPAFGLKKEETVFQPLSERQDLAGNTHLKFQHYHSGIPVFDGYLQLHFTASGLLLGMDGNIVAEIPKAPAILKADEVLARARQWVSKHFGEDALEKIEVEAEALNWFAEGQVQGRAGEPKLVYALTLSNREDIRQQIIIDAENGRVLDHFSEVCELAHRQLFSGNTNSTLIWQDGDAYPGALNDWQQTQVQTTSEVYNLFRYTFGIRSFDDADSDMLLVDQASFLSCPNASWNGHSTNYCNGISTDDVVGHEWGHAYSEYTSHLLFAWQAGAINEAYSDIWGETIDLLNSPAADKTLRTDECGNSDRWLIAEASEVFEGGLRDMWDPNCSGNPAKVTDPLYQCSSDDYGGVHINSTVVSHAYALLVDGGQYNGFTINGIGLSKAAHLFWHAQAYYLSRTSDFVALADALTAAYLDLRELSLPELTIEETESTTYQQLNSADSLSLQQVIAAVELRLPPDCDNFLSALQPGAPEICLANDEVLTPFFSEDFEAGTNGWTLSAHPEDPGSWVPRHWALKTTLPEDRPGTAIYAVNPAVGHCDTLPNNGSLRLKTPLIQIPADIEGDVYLVFDHYFSLEDGVDGANVKLQQNNGAWLRIPPMAFLHNGYNDILPQSLYTDNPLAGDRVWTGADIGSTTGSWGTTQINLSVLGVEAGETIRLRWELGTDGCDGWDGWYVDDIYVGSCALSALPVEWLSFSAELQKENTAVLLQWQTSQEEDNKGFFVERSTDGRSFTELGFVPAVAFSGAINHYSFIDDQLSAHTAQWYYRLRQEDIDGTISYSPLRSVERTTVGEWICSPNPAQAETTLSWPDAPFAEARVLLRQPQGKIMAQIPSWAPTTPLKLALDNYPPGVYLLQVQTDDMVYSKRLLIQ